MVARARCIVALAALAGGCFSPTYATNLQCSPSGACPPDQTCDVASNMCVAGCLPGCNGAELRDCVNPPTTCALGCAPAPAHCRQLVPANGVTSALTVGTRSLVVSGTWTFHTDTGAIDPGVRPAGADAVMEGIWFSVVSGMGVFAVNGLQVPADAALVASGGPALIIVSAGDVSVGGVISVSAAAQNGGCATPGTCPGPGGARGAVSGTAAAGCGPGHNGSGTSEAATGGGGGGGHSGAGARGGQSSTMVAGGVGGGACSDGTLAPLVGGSGGGAGGPAGVAIAQGAGGAGGGAIQLVSFTRIAILAGAMPAGIDAGGGGGVALLSGGIASAGGGGGAGGAILLEAPTLELAAGAAMPTFAAIGGGGAGGGCAGATNGGSGSLDVASGHGGVASSPSPNCPSGSNGGDGGGAGPATPGGDGALITGGGGGAAGLIRLNVVTLRGGFAAYPAPVVTLPILE
jgi:hypothetical protein